MLTVWFVFGIATAIVSGRLGTLLDGGDGGFLYAASG